MAHFSCVPEPSTTRPLLTTFWFCLQVYRRLVVDGVPATALHKSADSRNESVMVRDDREFMLEYTKLHLASPRGPPHDFPLFYIRSSCALYELQVAETVSCLISAMDSLRLSFRAVGACSAILCGIRRIN